MKKLSFFIFLLVCIILSISCGNVSETGNQTLVVAISGDIISMDPSAQNDSYSANVMKQMYEGLLILTPDNKILPGLADRYEISDDGMDYTFHLKHGVKFHNGDEMKAEDVVFSFTRAFNSPAVFHIFSDIDPQTIKAVDEYTVNFKMKEPYSGILMALCHSSAYILSKRAVEESGGLYSNTPIGTGPYKFISHIKSDKIIFERFADYHSEKPYFMNLEYRIIPESSKRMVELESGSADIIFDVSPNDLDKFNYNKDINLIRLFDYTTQYLGMNCSKPPLDDVRVRKAIACAIDTDRIVKTVWKGLGKTATAPYAPSIKYSMSNNFKSTKRDVEKSKRLLKEAGYGNGLKLKLYTNERSERVDMAVLMKEQFKDAGIDITIEVLDMSNYIKMLQSGTHELFEIGWSSDTSDPDMVVYPCFHSISQGAGGNYTFLSDDILDDMIIKGRHTVDGPERAEIYKKIQERIMDLTPAVFQYNEEQTAGIKSNLTGLVLSPLGTHFLGNIKPSNNIK